ncbi:MULTISPECIES: depupylase/deamidase Dop [Bifidobacterium]|uniref:depupylase/deamidase Dop n=1 Tax=Bifidobacterium TaxID=1678 RepID=UPI001BDCA68B|nr:MULTISPECIES: depupylase/deamidase Dop [Bifidobacterium]MBT1161050.1 proteasome accessory factor PafA2 [Bifidobacterium sp. SO1]MBW3078126.1 proteasome accessory factor PafA2 [Bifidobacterium simiiventris]
MSVIRVMGTETEYAVSRADGQHANPVQLSFDVVGAAATEANAHIRWDYRQEDPVNDARGTRLERAAARPDMLTDAPQLNIVNVIAANGGRVYVDHAHPEYSAPETTDPFEAVRYDHAGDRIMLAAARKATDITGRPIVLHRNNVDGKGASWGTHENYMMLRSVPFDTVARLMTAHFVTRQIYTGSGRVGIGEHSETDGYQLSQRADYFHMKVGLQTTFDRPIINTRDESHSTDQYRRLHVIVGDANRMDVPQTLKLGTTSMLLWLAEHADEAGLDMDDLLGQIELADPVAAIHDVSHDLTLAEPLPLEHGGTMTAWQIQVTLRAAVYAASAMMYGTDTKGEPVWPDKPTRSIMAMWGQALADTGAIRHADDDHRLQLSAEAGRIEWLFKWQLLEKLRRKGSGSWQDPKLKAVDLSWAALDPARSVFGKLRSHTERVNTDAEIAAAAEHAPEDTRAWLRAAIVNRYPEQVVAASWSHLTVRAHPDAVDDIDWYGNASRPQIRQSDLFTLDMSDPLRFDRSACERIVDECSSAAETLSRLSAIITTSR